jgi:hypothetical protein
MRLFSRLEYEQKSYVNCSSYFMRVPKLVTQIALSFIQEQGESA